MKIISKILFIVSIAVFTVSLVLLGISLFEYSQGDSIYNNAVDTFVIEPIILPNNSNTIDDNNNISSSTIENNTKSPEPAIAIDFDSLININKDVIGWFYIPNTIISYPLLFGVDNDKYLTKTFDHKYNKFGSIFTDMYSKHDLTSQNTIIYGHNIHNGSMFSKILEYENQEFFEQNKYIYILTDEGYNKYEVFSAYLTKVQDGVYVKKDMTQTKFIDYLTMIRKNSLIESDLEVTNKSKIITLSTCESTTAINDNRFVVFAKLIEENKNNIYKNKK